MIPREEKLYQIIEELFTIATPGNLKNALWARYQEIVEKEIPIKPEERDIPGIIPMNIAGQLCINLKKYRELAHLTHSELARRSGVSRTHIGQIEHGESVPTIEVVQQLATGLRITIETLLGLNEIKQSAGMTLHTAIARSTGSKATTHLDDATELIVHELSFLRRVEQEQETIIKRYDVMHIDADGLMSRWNSCTPSELLYQLGQFEIGDTFTKRWSPLEQVD